MKKIIQIYKKDHLPIVSHIRGLVSSLPKDIMSESKAIFKKYKYISMMYTVDSEYKQSSPSINRNKNLSENIGSDKSHYFSNVIVAVIEFKI